LLIQIRKRIFLFTNYYFNNQLNFKNKLTKHYRYYLLFVVLLVNLTADDHSVRFDHYSTEQGLSQNTVFCITQDRYGFMWFGTRYGLNRFDGYDFKTFYHDPQDSLSLSQNMIQAICEDYNGDLWIGTDGGGLDRFDQVCQRFNNFRQQPDDPGSLSNNFVTSLLVDSHGNLWAGTKKGLNRFNPDSQNFTSFYQDNTPGVANDNITCLIEFPAGTLWIGTASGHLTKHNIASDQFKTIHPERLHPNRAKNNYISSLSCDSRDSSLWIGVFPIGIFQYNLVNDSLKSLQIDSIDPNRPSVVAPYSIIVDQIGNVWIGSVYGLTKYDPNSNKYTYHRPDESDRYSISDYVINCLFLDDQESMWIGTDAKGINKYDPDLIRFEHYKHEADNDSSLPHNRVYSISEDLSGNIWIGSMGGGLSKIINDGNSFKYYQSDDSVPGTWSSNYIMKLTCSQDYLVWLATYGSGLFSFDPATEKFRLYRNVPSDTTSISGNRVMAVYEDHQGYIWAGTMEQGLNRLDRSTGEFTRYRHEPSDSASISGNTIYAITEDSSGQLWIGTYGGGLNRYNRGSNSFNGYKVESGNPTSISSNNIITMTVDSHNRLWIGTRGGGLNRFDQDSELFARIGKEDGLPGDVVNGILEDDDGYLWISTNQGISRFHPTHLDFTNYSIEDGLQGEEFYYGSCLKSRSGKMYFGGDGGFNVFRPEEVKNNLHLPPVVLTDIQINYQSLESSDWSAPHFLQKLPLTYKDLVITFEFAALDYSVPRKNQYAYQLEGFDQNLIQAGTKRQVTYTNLDPGSYTFHVRGSNNDCLWNTTGIQLPIVIAPPFWKTIWFRLLAVLIISGLIIGRIKVRLNGIRKIEQRKAAEREIQLKLDHQQRELVTKSMDLIEKQDFMEEVLQELKMLKDASDPDRSRVLRKLIGHLSQLTSFNHVWEEFEKWFSEIHTGFISNLRSDYPKLTFREIKVCALLRLNLMSKEIASLMNVEPTSVEIYRYRIRKKLGLSKGDNLSNFLDKY